MTTRKITVKNSVPYVDIPIQMKDGSTFTLGAGKSHTFDEDKLSAGALNIYKTSPYVKISFADPNKDDAEELARMAAEEAEEALAEEQRRLEEEAEENRRLEEERLAQEEEARKAAKAAEEEAAKQERLAAEKVANQAKSKKR